QQRRDYRQLEPDGAGEADESTHHEDVAVGEIDQAQDSVDHRIAQRNQGIDAAELQGIERLLQPKLQTETSPEPLQKQGGAGCRTRPHLFRRAWAVAAQPRLPACDSSRRPLASRPLASWSLKTPYGATESKYRNWPSLIWTTTALLIGSPVPSNRMVPVTPSKSVMLARAFRTASRSTRPAFCSAWKSMCIES